MKMKINLISDESEVNIEIFQEESFLLKEKEKTTREHPKI